MKIRKFFYTIFFYTIFFSYKILIAYAFSSTTEQELFKQLCVNCSLQTKIFFSKNLLRQNFFLFDTFIVFIYTNVMSQLVNFFTNDKNSFFTNVVASVFFSSFLNINEFTLKNFVDFFNFFDNKFFHIYNFFFKIIFFFNMCFFLVLNFLVI